MRYPASEKLEIIRLVEQSHLPVKRTLDRLGLPRSTFYAWYDRYQSGGVEALEDKAPMPARIWNRIPDDIRQQINEIQSDPEIDAEAKKKMIASLEAMIASDNNKSVIRQLMGDEYYADKLKLLEETE